MQIQELRCCKHPPPLHTHTHTHAHAHTHILSPQKKRKRGCNSPALALLSLSVAFKILSVFTTGSTSNQPGYGMPADTQARLAAQKEGTLESETKNKYKKKTSKKALSGEETQKQTKPLPSSARCWSGSDGSLGAHIFTAVWHGGEKTCTAICTINTTYLPLLRRFLPQQTPSIFPAFHIDIYSMRFLPR